MPTAISQTVNFDVSVDRAYRAVADSEEHSAFTGAPAVIPDEPGAAFSTHGGAIEGLMLEMTPNQRIVQAWRPADWPEGNYSVVRYDFEGDDAAVQITLTHTGLPEEGAAHIAEGWEQRYWKPLGEYFAKA